jgi:hypothetical protein
VKSHRGTFVVRHADDRRLLVGRLKARLLGLCSFRGLTFLLRILGFQLGILGANWTPYHNKCNQQSEVRQEINETVPCVHA